MRCAGCDHILWNHPAPADGAPRACPECGRPYTVAEFEFVPGRVEFRCPSCDMAYFGTSATGHLEPPAFDCLGCGAPIQEERCTLRPHGADGVVAPMLREPLPWLEPGGLAGRWWRTTRISITRGAQLPSMLRPEPALGPALAYLAINAWLVAAVGAAYSLGWVAFVSGVMTVGQGGPFRIIPGTLGQIVVQGVVLATAPLFMLAVAALTACFAALPGGRFAADFRRFLEILAYATGNLVFGVVPICGGAVGFVLWIVQGAQGIAEASPRGRATGPVVLAIVGFVVGISVYGVASVAVGLLLGF